MNSLLVPALWRAFLATVATTFALEPSTAQTACGFKQSFDRPDERGKETVHVYEGSATAGIGGQRPLAFVTSLKVNTDGTRISYKVDDPRANSGAINDIRNAYVDPSRPISDFEDLVRSDWQPVSKVWQMLDESIIERDKRKAGRPCIDAEGYLVSMTAVGSVANAGSRAGDCDQSKWLDAITVPAVVLPKADKKHPSQFAAKNAKKRTVAIVMSLKEPRRFSFGIVGDAGPVNELGEASVAMNRQLNGPPETGIPKNRADAKRRFQAGRSVVLLLPGDANRAPFPLTLKTVMSFAQKHFNAWSGGARLKSCLKEIPEAN